MKIFLSYKQSGISNNELDKNLGFIHKIINKSGNSSFIYYFDADSKLKASEINDIAIKNIKNSDLIIGFINDKEKSEGQLLELGMSYSLNKKILILVKSNIKENYFLSYGLKSDIITFNNINEIETLLTNYLIGK